MPVGHLYVFFEKNVYLNPLPIFNWVVVLSCMSALYILDINPYQIYDLQISFPFNKLPFHLDDGFLQSAETF